MKQNSVLDHARQYLILTIAYFSFGLGFTFFVILNSGLDNFIKNYDFILAVSFFISVFTGNYVVWTLYGIDEKTKWFRFTD